MRGSVLDGLVDRWNLMRERLEVKSVDGLVFGLVSGFKTGCCLNKR